MWDTGDSKVEQLCSCWCSTQRRLTGSELLQFVWLWRSITLRYDYLRQACFSTQNISAAFFLISEAGRRHSQDLFESAECYLWLLVHAAGIEDSGKNTYQLMAALFKIIPLPIIAAAEDSGCSQQLLLMWQSMLRASDRCQHEPAIMVQMPNCSFSVSVKQSMTRQEKFSCPKICSAKTARLKRVGWSLLWEPRAITAGERETKNGVFCWCIDQMFLCNQPPSNFWKTN